MNTIPVVYASDNNYVLPTVVSITSLLKNKNKDTFYTIFIINTGITSENKINFLWEQYKNEYELFFIPFDLNEFKDINSFGNWTPTIYAKYFICDLINGYKKCIWLDGDTIIQADLSELYNTKLFDCHLGAVKSPATNYNVAAEKHTFLEREKYNLKCINVGVLLLNLESLKNLGGGGYFLKETLKAISLLPSWTIVTEQDMFNKLLSENIVYLPLKYNLYVDNAAFHERPYFPFCFSRKIIEEAFEAPQIIHYTVAEKPWKYSNAETVYASPFKKYRRLWDMYYLISPFGDRPLHRKKISLLRRFWYASKPILKKSRFLLNIKRKLCGTKIDSPIYDFFD